jgi:hypothetical protein
LTIGISFDKEKLILYYNIEDYIFAKFEASVADYKIRMSLRGNFAEKSFRQIKARGSETASPNVYEYWVLE